MASVSRRSNEASRGGGPDITALRELFPGRVKSGLKRLARLPERLLHPTRRRQARDRLGEVVASVQSVLFVCYGNICRSPFAERAFEASLPAAASRELSVESTGFHPEQGRSSPEEAVDAAAELGVDLTGHRSRSLLSGSADQGKYERFVVFVMDPGQRQRFQETLRGSTLGIFVLGDFDPVPVERRAIRDPFGHPPEVFDETFGRIRRCVSEIASVWTGEAR